MSVLNDLLAEWRHEIHRHPELAFKENRTAAFVAEKLREMGIEVCEGIGGTGVVGTLKAGDGKRIIGLREDMDAIAIQEAGDREYRSEVSGVMHACGHDGHTATLLGAAKILSESRDFNGTVRFIFQPAEEPGTGAKAMIDDGFFERFPIDELYGLHNWPGLPAGVAATRSGGISASSDYFSIKIKGYPAHASQPQDTVDALVTAAQIITALQTIVSRNIDPLHTAVISCTEIITDGAMDVIPGSVEIRGNARCTDPADRKLLAEKVEEISRGICRAAGAECDVDYDFVFAPVYNDPACTAHAVEAMRKVFGEQNVIADCTPTMAAEDCGLFMEKAPGCYIILGGGRNDSDPPVHNPEFDYNDDILEPGARYLAQIVRDRLPLI